MADDRNVMLEDMRIIFRNFSGKEGPYNRAGDRNFAVVLDQETAAKMYDDSWNIKVLKAREEGDPETPYLPVAVSYKGRPPRIVMVTSRGRTTLTEDEVEMLDWVDIRKADLIVRPYDWTVSGKSGTKAYLQSIFVTIEEDALELKYADMQDASLRKRPDDD